MNLAPEWRRLCEQNTRLLEALTLFRGLVDEGCVPRYTITPGAALNSLIEEVVDPALRFCAEPVPELDKSGRSDRI
jgi:hypothetical protein